MTPKVVLGIIIFGLCIWFAGNLGELVGLGFISGLAGTLAGAVVFLQLLVSAARPHIRSLLQKRLD